MDRSPKRRLFPSTRAGRARLLGLGAAGLAVGLLGLSLAGRFEPPQARPAPVAAPAASSPEERGPRPLVRVGEETISSEDLGRFMAFTELVHPVGEREALADLVEQTLLLRHARDQGWAAPSLEVELMRTKVQIIASASPTGTEAPAGFEAVLSKRGISAQAFDAELQAHVLADEVRRREVWDKIEVPAGELDQEVVQRMAALRLRSAPAAQRKLIRADARRQLARRRSGEAEAAFVASLRRRWPVESLSQAVETASARTR